MRLKLSEDIVPLGEFKARAARILRDLPSRSGPLVVTQNGRPACVVLSPAQYDRLSHLQSFSDAIEEGLADVRAQRIISDEELIAQLDAELGPVEAE